MYVNHILCIQNNLSYWVLLLYCYINKDEGTGALKRQFMRKVVLTRILRKMVPNSTEFLESGDQQDIFHYFLMKGSYFLYSFSMILTSLSCNRFVIFVICFLLFFWLKKFLQFHLKLWVPKLNTTKQRTKF